ncbi:serine/threonine-protein kinase [Sutcliffiella rhizosphaerae]|uniref:Serine/threonine-protein kinase YabT n=1 Tax=Sutcliffiella rhizosphaerae TaxID=2880967 RepID=A0ABM8YTY6_9BACI|nr:serine/threonine-protein kinase [Sutcliffiella rhizosphaerae]CAG9623429.1 putative serine/threonine-protein kinase YabT [Sutcliffiella rhizosphaerae]
MMNNTMKNPVGNLPKGTVIIGKWHKHKYTILKTLGYGATGYVYLTEGPNGFAALKISENSMSITSEVNVLRHFSKVRGFSLGPSLLDVDDWENGRVGTGRFSFYVMEYLKGHALHIFIQGRGMEWTGILILQLLTDLQTLHQEGWVFGDLKPDNLIVTESPPKIRLLDVGGTTLQGRAIKEFTEFFDRGYWGLGSRKADASYDLFAVAMIMIHICYPKQFQKTGEGGLHQLNEYIRKNAWLNKHESVLVRALKGNYQSALEMKMDMLGLMSKRQDNPALKQKYTPPPTNNRSTKAKVATNVHVPQNKQGSTKKGWTETAVLLSAILLAYFFYLYGQIM